MRKKSYIVIYEGYFPKIIKAEKIEDIEKDELTEVEMIYSASGKLPYGIGI